MSAQQPRSFHTPSLVMGAVIALSGIGVGAFVTSGPGAPRALAASSPEAGDSIPAIELDANTTALVIDRRGIYFMIDNNARAFPVRYEDQVLRNVPGEEILRAR